MTITTAKSTATLARAVGQAYARPVAGPLVGPFAGSFAGSFAVPLALSALLLAPYAHAVDLDTIQRSLNGIDVVKPGFNTWRIEPTIDLRETYSDNVLLQANERAHGQFITDISPGVLVKHKSRRLKLDGQYLLHLYAHTGEDYGTRRSSSQLRAAAKAELIDEMLFVDTNLSMQLQSISPFAPLLSGNDYANTNSANVKTWQISPYLVNHFGHIARSELRYLHDSVDAGNSGLGSTQGDTLSFQVTSGSRWDKLNWGVHGSDQKIRDKARADSTIRTGVVNLGYQLLPTFAVTAAGYYDDYNYQSVGGSNGGKGGTAGFRWTPSRRSSIEASYGHRYYGPSGYLKMLHGSRRTSWDISYDDSVTTSRSNFLRNGGIVPGAVIPVPGTTAPADLGGLFIPDGPPVILPPPVIPPVFTGYTNFFSNRFFLQKQLRASVSMNLPRTTGLVSVFKVRREALSLRDTDSALLGNALDGVNDNVEQVGVSGLASYVLTPRSNLNFSADIMDNKSLTTGFKARSNAFHVTLRHQLGRKMSAYAELRRVSGVTGLTTGSRYTENALTIALNMKL